MKYCCISPSTPQMVELATQREDRDGCVFFLIKLSLGWWFWASSLIGLPNFNDFMNPCDQNRKQAEFILSCTPRLLKLSPHPFLASAHNCNSFHSDPAARCRHAAVKRTELCQWTFMREKVSIPRFSIIYLSLFCEPYFSDFVYCSFWTVKLHAE